MINNNLCDNCAKATVCKIKDTLDKFSDDAKKDLGVDIAMEACDNLSIDMNKPEG